METRASYLAAGIFVIVTFIGLVIFLMWMSQVDWSGKGQKYDIYFSGSVTGLGKSSDVTYNGVPIGKVELIDIDPKKIDLVHVEVRIDQPKLIREDSYATLESKGITGTLQVRIMGGTRSSPSLKAKEGEERPVIRSQTSIIQSLIEETPLIMQKISNLLEDIRPIFNTNNIDSFSRSIRNLQEITSSLAEQRGAMDRLFFNVNQTLETIRKAGGTFDSAMGQFDKFLVDNGPYILKFTSTGLQSTSDLMDRLSELSKTVDRIATKVDKGPMQFLLQSNSQGEILPQ